MAAGRGGGPRRPNPLGERIKRRREELRLNQDVVAPQIGRSLRWYVDLEAGRVDPPIGVLRELAIVLNTTLDWLILDPSLRKQSRTFASVVGTMAVEEDEAKRRAFLAWLAAAGSGLIDVERLTAPAVDGLYRRNAEAVTVSLLDCWYEAAPSLLLPPVLAHLRGLQRALPGPPELENLTGRTALLAGYLFSKLEQGGEARLYFALAEAMARDTNDGHLRAVTLVARSALHSWRLTSDTRRSHALVAEAAEAMGSGAPGLLRSAVLARRAEEHAAAGDVTGFEHDMAAAEAAIRPGGDHWYGPRDAAELAAVRGASELLLGRHRDAAETLTWTIERMDPSAVNWRAVVAADRDRALAAG